MKPEKQLYQWDVNQYLTGINPAAQYVDYTIGNDVIRLETDGTRCRIPDEVLQTYGGKTCYERYPDGTYRAYSFTVLYAPKPPDYVYTTEERTTFEALTDRVDAAIEEIKRRADSGEFTPKKGVDYFTDAEKTEMMESVSSGAVGEFRKVVDTATAEYNDNHNLQLAKYNANASEKLTTYDTNAEQQTTDYNRNAEQKLEAYNQNHTEKVEEYNQNAAALQEQMSEKANVDGYYEEMTVGDAEQLISTQFVEDNKPYLFRSTGGSSDVGNRAYLDKIVGGTVAWNQLVTNGNFEDYSRWHTDDRCTLAINNNIATITVNSAGISAGRMGISQFGSHIPTPIAKHKYYLSIDLNSSVSLTSSSSWQYGSSVVYRFSAEANAWIRKQAISSEISPVGKYMEFKCFGSFVEGSTIQIRNAMIIDLTQMFGSTIADYVYSLEQSQAGAGVAWFKKLFHNDYYPYNAGELLSVEGLQSHDTVGFNQFDKNTMVVENVYIDDVDGVEKSNTGALSTDFIPVIPNTAYFINTEQTAGGLGAWYDADKNYISGITGYANVDPTYKVKTAPDNAYYMRLTCRYNNNGNIDTFCINLSNPSRNGEYEEYVKHSYPLDSSLTLRGIPKLDASNNLYYDGDEYTSDGKAKRKYGIYTIQASNVSLNNNAYTNISYAEIVNLPNMLKSIDKQCVHSKFGVGKRGYPFDDAGLVGKLLTNSSINGFWFGFAKGTTEEQVKSALDGTTIIYELATPTTETAEPFQRIQIVDDFGTEEFVSTGIIPVGHKTRYPANLRDKLQHLPDLAGMDGTYLIRQTGKQMSLVYMPAVFPDTPTEDGTYTLKTVVAGGVATLQWVVE